MVRYWEHEHWKSTLERVHERVYSQNHAVFYVRQGAAAEYDKRHEFDDIRYNLYYMLVKMLGQMWFCLLWICLKYMTISMLYQFSWIDCAIVTALIIYECILYTCTHRSVTFITTILQMDSWILIAIHIRVICRQQKQHSQWWLMRL